MAAVGAPATPSATAPPFWLPRSVSRSGVLVALVVTLLISRLPQIIVREGMGLDVSWMQWAIVGVTLLLWLAARSLRQFRPLEGFLAVMVVVNLGVAALEVVLASALWQSIVTDATQPMIALLASRVLFALVAILALTWAKSLGASRDDLYLRPGYLDAPTTTRRKDGSYLRWKRFGPVAFFGFMLLMVWFAVPILPDRIDLVAAAPYIVVGALGALLNAFWEEAAFRAAPLSMLQRAVGPSAGVLILALYFGLGHFYGGVPSGPWGFLAAGAAGLLFGRAMIETRGLAWPIGLHFAGDLVIFTFLAIASVA
jgi:membrane protease YdiL (CAAX protease family)